MTKTTLRQCSRIALALLVMTGRVTLVGLSRWAGTGGSERTVQRCVATAMPWATLCWVCFRHQVYRSEDASLLVGDAVVVTTAGTTTHSLDRCCASRYGTPVPGLACCALSAAHRSLCMVHVAYRLRADVHPRAPDSSVLDVKADCRGDKYVEETIQMLPEKPAPIFFAKILHQVAGLGRIHASQASCSFP